MNPAVFPIMKLSSGNRQLLRGSHRSRSMSRHSHSKLVDVINDNDVDGHLKVFESSSGESALLDHHRCKIVWITRVSL